MEFSSLIVYQGSGVRVQVSDVRFQVSGFRFQNKGFRQLKLIILTNT